MYFMTPIHGADCSGLVNLVFGIDKSGSVRRDGFHVILRLVKEVSNHLEVGTIHFTKLYHSFSSQVIAEL
jgi:hypothetical protein